MVEIVWKSRERSLRRYVRRVPGNRDAYACGRAKHDGSYLTSTLSAEDIYHEHDVEIFG